MTSIYNIKTYLLYRLNDFEVILQNHLGIVRIKEQRMIDFLYHIDDEVLREISKNKIEEYFGSDTYQAIEFLEKNKVLSNVKKTDFNFDKIFLFCNEKQQLSYLNEIMNEKKIKVIYGMIEEIEKYELDNSLVLVFQNPYNKIRSRKIIEYINQFEDNLLIMSYIYNNVFYIDNVYTKELNNPCHFCNMGFIESQIRSSEDDQISYQDLIDEIYEIDDKFEVNHPLTIINNLKISIYLYDFLIIYLDNNKKLSNRDILNCFRFDLNKNIKMTDTAIHWELCDCYE
ncbi:McbB family protein [Mammaliicoccus sciuri]|uniref:McbB family protein n=1 Tax=Mammaliicoccus sciuri TaxID=1296 RepID=UPI003F56FF9B